MKKSDVDRLHARKVMVFSLLKTSFEFLMDRNRFSPDLSWTSQYLITCLGKPELSDHFKTPVICYKGKGHTADIRKQSACLAVNPITADRFN